MRANMRPALPNGNALDRGSANKAGITCALVNAEVILKIASLVDPVDAGPLALDAILQHLADAGPQSFGLLSVKVVGDR